MISSRNNTQFWPTVLDYDKALQNAKGTVYDPDIKNGTLAMDATGPLYLNDAKAGGKYVCVYRVSKWVVKCFTDTPPPDIRERYLAINSCVSQNAAQLSFLVPHNWIDRGLKIDGKDWPFIKSDYLEHMSLGVFLQERCKERNVVSALAKQWYHIASTMDSLGIAHGDLDVTNILICTPDTSPTIRLIDFDSMYVPALATPGRKLWEHGHEHFQPLERNIRNFNKEMDRFSSLIIYLSLTALVEDPTLWESCKANEENKLLLGSGDFQQIGVSHAYQQLRAKQNNENLQKCLDELVLSIQEKRMPRSLSEILHGLRRSVVQREYQPVDMPVPLDNFTQPTISVNLVPLTSNSQAFSSVQPTLSSPQRELDIAIPLEYIEPSRNRPASPPQVSSVSTPQKKARSGFWLVFSVLVISIVIALPASATAPGIWVLPAIILIVLIAIARRPSRL